ncbi:hypothetical protein M885DRAFT_514831 [Pelagophyceae sp. CCMP2097]|nr:hypothetical protein M885DRAFT_514831 [Pelagophyceae sp. CCMP2097]|mmetsp:Transcript_27682/g.93009  ORF Transcript_27682/g.93009 Transcript_27682/m.93009 type:complete len:245 (-) Transcript_27682:180-914(-)
MLGRIFWVAAVVAAKDGASPSEVLWRDNAALAQASLRDPFVAALGAGTLRREAFAGYVRQDAYFLTCFAKAYGRAIGKCGGGYAASARCVDSLRALLGAVSEELLLHAAYAAQWGVDLDEDLPAMAATDDYVRFLDRVSTDAESSIGDVLAAMAPCMRLYAFLGTTLAAAGAERTDNPYAEWVTTYASADFGQAAETVERLLDEHLPSLTRRASDNYAEAMKLELAFFAAHDGSPASDSTAPEL